jgi:hypothetical protein
MLQDVDHRVLTLKPAAQATEASRNQIPPSDNKIRSGIPEPTRAKHSIRYRGSHYSKPSTVEAWMLVAFAGAVARPWSGKAVAKDHF